MYKAAVIGDRDSIYGFAALGLDIFEIGNEKNGSAILHRLAEGDYAVIYVTEVLYAELLDEIEEYKERLIPAIIPIPGVKGNNGIGQLSVRSFVEKAVGADII